MDAMVGTSRAVLERGRAALKSPARWRQLGALGLGLVFGCLVLLALNFGLSYPIWGELVVAWAVLAIALFGATRIADGRLVNWVGVRPMPIWQAGAWALVVVVGIPLAYTFGRWGVGVLLMTPVVFWGVQLRVDREETTRFGKLLTELWVGALAGALLLMLIAVFIPNQFTDEDTAAKATAPLLEAKMLAWQFRPRLFFDSAEQFIPIDIEDAISAKRITGCERGTLQKTDPDDPEACNRVADPNGFARDFDYVTVDAGPLASGQPAGGSDSAIYYHVSRGSTGRIFIDYWWYFVENPSPVLSRLLCGAALSWAPLICGKHASDWEGVTVVLGSCGQADGTEQGCFQTKLGRRRLVEVHYAQHEHTHAYSWEQLREARAKFDKELWRGAPARPRVFVARSSHASYRIPCAGSLCSQSTRKFLTERRNGLLPWTNNDGGLCVRELQPNEEETDKRFVCLKPLPTNDAGAPSQWNAYNGRWGTQKCVLSGAFCDGQQPPRGPAFQYRYENPQEALYTDERPWWRRWLESVT